MKPGTKVTLIICATVGFVTLIGAATYTGDLREVLQFFGKLVLEWVE